MNTAGRISPFDRLGLALFVAVVAHAMLILGIGFTYSPPEKETTTEHPLEIMVVRNPTRPEAPKDADFLSQVNQQGGGNEQERVKPTTRITPPAPTRAPLDAPDLKPPSSESPPSPDREVLAVRAKTIPKAVVTQERKPTPTARPKVTAAQLLDSSMREIDRLTAELERKNQARAKWQKHKQLTASTREYKYASYLDAWVRKVERIGNLNYPDEAKRRKLYGNLILHAAIKPDGSVLEINVRKSSGHKLLDDAAVRIVQLAAPFAPFPDDIRKETDILDIIRTWQFRNNNQLSSK
ncbi:MAG: energy transducer TonB [Gammaproteobacteria bacterium]|nr:energy transducer TonB [Gammaproteobacteria bacterium]